MSINWKQLSIAGTFLMLQFMLSAQTNLGSLSGTTSDIEGNSLPFVCVRIDGTDKGCYSDIEGRYRIDLEPGYYNIVAEYIGFIPVKKDSVLIELNKVTTFNLNFKEVTDVQVETVKPIIYCYPEDTTELRISIAYKGELTTTYPKYPEDGWKVTATPVGTLIDTNNREYYALYWEGNPTHPLTISEGQVVARDNTIEFLENQLEQLGLNEREANEFIVYWLPILERNPYNVISFSFEAYENLAALTIEPQPDQLIRVMMLYQGLSTPIIIPSQEIVKNTVERKGFTVVEWGGQEANIIAP